MATCERRVMVSRRDSVRCGAEARWKITREESAAIQRMECDAHAAKTRRHIRRVPTLHVDLLTGVEMAKQSKAGDKPALYDDTYAGPRWRYGLQHRPLANYFNLSFPDPILFSDRPDPRFPYHGTADWPCEIPEDEARHHSLVLIGRVER